VISNEGRPPTTTDTIGNDGSSGSDDRSGAVNAKMHCAKSHRPSTACGALQTAADPGFGA